MRDNFEFDSNVVATRDPHDAKDREQITSIDAPSRIADRGAAASGGSRIADRGAGEDRGSRRWSGSRIGDRGAVFSSDPCPRPLLAVGNCIRDGNRVLGSIVAPLRDLNATIRSNLQS
jgi:hypothetical protein